MVKKLGILRRNINFWYILISYWHLWFASTENVRSTFTEPTSVWSDLMPMLSDGWSEIVSISSSRFTSYDQFSHILKPQDEQTQGKIMQNSGSNKKTTSEHMFENSERTGLKFNPM